MSTRDNYLTNEKAEKYVKAYVIGNLGDPGLDNDTYCDVKSRFVIAIKDFDKIPFVLKPGAVDNTEPSRRGIPNATEQDYNTSLLMQDNIILVKTPIETWITASTPVGNESQISQGNYTGLVRTDYIGHKNIGPKGAYLSEEIPRLNHPYKLLEEISIQKITALDSYRQDSPLFQSFFPLVPSKPVNLFNDTYDLGVLPNGYYDGVSNFESATNIYGENYLVMPNFGAPKWGGDNSVPPKKKWFPASITCSGYNSGNYFFLGFNKTAYQESTKNWLTLNESKKYGLNIDNVSECWGGRKVPSNYYYGFDYVYTMSSYATALEATMVKFKKIDSSYTPRSVIFNRAGGQGTYKFLAFSACLYEEVNSDRKREADPGCVPNVVVSPTDFATPQERKTSLIDFNISIPLYNT
jgi:hypothetical protein